MLSGSGLSANSALIAYKVDLRCDPREGFIGRIYIEVISLASFSVMKQDCGVVQ